MELRRTVIANRDRYAIIRDNLERGEQATDEMEAILNKRLARGEM
jgi:hypothetical protein